LLLVAFTSNLALAGDRDEREGDGDGRNAYAIGQWGDLPYSTTQATVGVPNLIADMNRQNLAFTAHDGDLKSGSSECTDAVYTQAVGYFRRSPCTRLLHSWRQRLGGL
jgi:hypothetical protein